MPAITPARPSGSGASPPPSISRCSDLKDSRRSARAFSSESHYAASQLATIPGVRAPYFDASHFKEFVVNFDATGKSVRQINAALRSMDIFGGHDLSVSHPELGQSALYCVTEVHTKADIDRLVNSIREVVA